MPFCASCGSQVEGRFCAKCGAAVGPASASAPPPPSGPAYPPPVPPASAAGLADNAASALCYALGVITGVLFLVLAPYNQNRTVRFHAFQSIFLTIAAFVVWIVIMIVGAMVFGLIGWWFAFAVWLVYRLACVALWLYMMITTYQGRAVALPIIGPLAQQQA